MKKLLVLVIVMALWVTMVSSVFADIQPSQMWMPQAGWRYRLYQPPLIKVANTTAEALFCFYPMPLDYPTPSDKCATSGRFGVPEWFVFVRVDERGVWLESSTHNRARDWPVTLGDLATYPNGGIEFKLDDISQLAVWSSDAVPGIDYETRTNHDFGDKVNGEYRYYADVSRAQAKKWPIWQWVVKWIQ